MRILQLTNKPPWPAKDGGSIAMWNLTKGFAGLGHQVTVLSMNTRKHLTPPETVPVKVKEIADIRFVSVPATVSPVSAVINLLFSNQPYNAVRFISREFKQVLRDLLKEKKFDLIQLEGLYLSPYIPVIREHTSAPVALRAHNIESEIWERTAALSSGLKKWYLRNLAGRILNFEKKWLNSYDLLVPITSRDGEWFNTAGNQKPVHISPAGIDSSLYRLTHDEPEFPSLFHIGSLDWSPNQEGLIWFLSRIWPTVHLKHPGLNLYIAGRNAPAWLVSKFQEQNVVYLGEVEDAHSFIRSKSVMIVPLFSGSGMRIKIIEGMALGKAIVSTPIGAEGLPVISGENILIAEKPEEFIRCLDEVIENKSRCEQLGSRAEKYVREHFDNRVIAGNLAAFYQEYCL